MQWLFCPSQPQLWQVNNRKIVILNKKARLGCFCCCNIWERSLCLADDCSVVIQFHRLVKIRLYCVVAALANNLPKLDNCSWGHRCLHFNAGFLVPRFWCWFAPVKAGRARNSQLRFKHLSEFCWCHQWFIIKTFLLFLTSSYNYVRHSSLPK